MSPFRALVLSDAHYFQAPATQATDSLCSELSESCVILTLELFVLQGVANFCCLLNLKSR